MKNPLTTPRPFSIRSWIVTVAVCLLLLVAMGAWSRHAAINHHQNWAAERNSTQVNSWADPQSGIIENYGILDNYYGVSYSAQIQLANGTTISRVVSADDIKVVETGGKLLIWDCAPSGTWPPCDEGQATITAANSADRPWGDGLIDTTYSPSLIDLWVWGIWPFVIGLCYAIAVALYLCQRVELNEKWQDDRNRDTIRQMEKQFEATESS